MRFNQTLDMTILQCVKFYSEYMAPHGKNQELYELVVQMFCRESGTDQSGVKLSWKTLYDCFNRLLDERREEAHSNELTSGNREQNSELQLELDSMIQYIDHFEDEKESMVASNNAELVSSGAQIRLEAMQRATTPNRTDHLAIDNGRQPGSSESSALKRLFETSDDEERDMVMMHVDRREEREKIVKDRRRALDNRVTASVAKNTELQQSLQSSGAAQ